MDIERLVEALEEYQKAKAQLERFNEMSVYDPTGDAEHRFRSHFHTASNELANKLNAIIDERIARILKGAFSG